MQENHNIWLFICPVYPLLPYLVYLLHSLSFGIELAVIYHDEIKPASVVVNWFGCEQTEDIFLDCCNSVMSPFHPWLYAYFAFLGHTETVCITCFCLVGCFLFCVCNFISFVICFINLVVLLIYDIYQVRGFFTVSGLLGTMLSS